VIFTGISAGWRNICRFLGNVVLCNKKMLIELTNQHLISYEIWLARMVTKALRRIALIMIELYSSRFFLFFCTNTSSGVNQYVFDIKYSPLIVDGSWLALSL
jgi:hypothetical protein